jgi:hypothetical protein
MTMRTRREAQMRNTHRTAVTGGVMAAVLAVGSLTLVSPAAADEPTMPVSTTAATVGSQPEIPGVTGTGGDVQTQASSTWTPGTEKGDDGGWVAYIECCGGFIREDVGTYETKREARRAAKRAAEEANGVMDGPGCDPPFVLC